MARSKKRRSTSDTVNRVGKGVDQATARSNALTKRCKSRRASVLQEPESFEFPNAVNQAGPGRDAEPSKRRAKGKRKRGGSPAPKESRATVAAAGARSTSAWDEPGKQPKDALYKAGDVILLVGEGDFSFASALVRKLGSQAFFVATAFDGAKQLRRKYPTAQANMKRLQASGMTVECGIDCRLLHQKDEFRGAFTKIVFNFPHLGDDEGPAASLEAHRELLREFLSSAAACLEPLPDSEVHVTLKAGEPYNSWRVQQLAKSTATGSGDATRLRCDRVVPFGASRYAGYTHRRTRGQAYEDAQGLDDRNVLNGAKTYVFKLTSASLAR